MACVVSVGEIAACCLESIACLYMLPSRVAYVRTLLVEWVFAPCLLSAAGGAKCGDQFPAWWLGYSYLAPTALGKPHNPIEGGVGRGRVLEGLLGLCH